LVEEALTALDDQFGREYRQAGQVINCVRTALKYVDDFSVFPVDAMEKLKCDTGADILAGAIYAALIYERDFDSAMIVAANHSGRSAAVGTVAGAILGARCGEEALPDFYMEGLEVATVLMELADDLIQGCPMVRGNKLFDGDWDRKYLHGEP
jgi:ADP-ribosylglycohydrolase